MSTIDWDQRKKLAAELAVWGKRNGMPREMMSAVAALGQPPLEKLRKVIQIATSSAAVRGSGEEIENLYALDSDGVIWQWQSWTESMMAGWEHLPEPWSNPPKKRQPKSEEPTSPTEAATVSAEQEQPAETAVEVAARETTDT